MLALAVALTVPIGQPNQDPEWLEIRRVSTRRMVADGILNVAIFVPFGWALHRTIRAAVPTAALLTVALASAGLSVSLETVQYFLSYRFSSLLDVVTNTAGGIAGALTDHLSRSE